MSQYNLIGIVKKTYYLMVFILLGFIYQLIFHDENLTISENIVGRLIYLYTTLLKSVVSIKNYEEIEEFRRNDCSLFKHIIFGFSNKKGLGLIVEHNIGNGESYEWSILDELKNNENKINNIHRIEIEEREELKNGLSLDMTKRRNKDDILINIIVSKELLEKNKKLREYLIKPLKCLNKKLCSKIYFKESKVKIIYEDINLNNRKQDKDQEAPGIVIYIHGGGFVLGDMNTYEIILKRHAIELGRSSNPSVIIYIEYRKSPKWKYPIPLEDVISSLSWIYNNANKLGLNPNKMVILGDSAGGNLATSSIASCLNIKNESKKYNNIFLKKYNNYCKWVDHIKYLGLIYPALCQKCITNSKIRNYRIGFLNWNSMAWFEKQYQSRYLENYYDWRSQPLLTPLNILEKFPRTGIVLVKSDILYDEGRLMYEILRKLKVETTMKVFTGKF